MRLANIRVYKVASKAITKELGEEQILFTALRILRDNVLCSMATVTREGSAHVNTAYFCYSDELELFFLSHPSAAHCRNVSHNPSMAMAVFASSQQWVGPDSGVQLFGTCGQAMGHHATKAEELYGKRFSAYATWKASRKDGDFAQEYRFYRSVVHRLKILDEATFGEAVFVSADVMRT